VSRFAWTILLEAALVGVMGGCATLPDARPRIPHIAGDWWTIARNPDLGELNGPPTGHPQRTQQPVDFAIWQAADGTWQLWSCIRNTNCGGNTRLFYRWEGQRLTDPDWRPMGIAMRADPRYGETPSGLQAPHVVQSEGVYYMFYGDWEHICLQRSKDGKTFERWPYENGKVGMFTEGPGANTRDPMAMQIDGRWYCYYMGNPQRVGSVYLRTSKDLRDWSDGKVVGRGGMTGKRPNTAECPHVIQIDGYYYLFRTQSYRNPPLTCVYRSKDPEDLGIDNDACFLCLLPVGAPEIISHKGEYFLAALCPDVQGIRIARLVWLPDRVTTDPG